VAIGTHSTITYLSPNPITFKILFAESMKYVYQSEFGKSEDIFRIKVESGG
jgi:hypothetical protein